MSLPRTDTLQASQTSQLSPLNDGHMIYQIGGFHHLHCLVGILLVVIFIGFGFLYSTDNMYFVVVAESHQMGSRRKCSAPSARGQRRSHGPSATLRRLDSPGLDVQCRSVT